MFPVDLGLGLIGFVEYKEQMDALKRVFHEQRFVDRLTDSGFEVLRNAWNKRHIELFGGEEEWPKEK